MNGGNNYGNRLDNRQRGNASQLLEKYRALARDAQQSGDRVTAEYYLQYADHYYRVLGDYREKAPADGRQRGQNFYEDESASGYAASGDDGDDGDEDQDGDRVDTRTQDDRTDSRSDSRQDNRPDGRPENRGDNRAESRSESRSDDNRSQWRDDRGGQNGNQNSSRRDGQREQRSEMRNEPRSDGNRTENRERQGVSVNSAPRGRDENRIERPREENRSRDDSRPRTEARAEQPREENRVERPREDNRGDRNINRNRRPEAEQPAAVEVPEMRATEVRSVNEGPIPGLPGPATLRVKRPIDDDAPPRPERVSRAPRREAAVQSVASPVLDLIVPELPQEAPTDVPGVEGETVAPRRRGRPRKIVDATPVEG